MGSNDGGLLLLGTPAWAQATPKEEWEALNARVVQIQLCQEGKYKEANSWRSWH